MEGRRFSHDEARAARAARFAAQLAEALYTLNLTHQALAAILGVPRYTVDSWTRGDAAKIPGPHNLAALCTLLDARRPGLGQALAAAAGGAWPPPSVAASALASAPPAAPPAAGNLPLQLTRFIGRRAALAAVLELLGTGRLVTLTGAGGVGKTRLALAVGSSLLPRFADGVWLVELAALTDPTLVPHALASTLNVPEPPAGSLIPALVAHLRPKHLLLVLDNCEHLVTACATLADHLLRTCPQLHLLTTSREPLRLAGEVAWRVPSLALPALSLGAGARDLLTRLPEYEAVQLFLDRARAGHPAFVLTAQNAPAVVQLCRQLDGIPLALELAATRLQVLTVEQIVARLDDRFRLLTRGARTALPRQQTLQALLDWSYDLLPAAEQTLLRRLAVFAGTWTLEDAEQVSSGPWAGRPVDPLPTPLDVDDGLSQLVAKSLVVREEVGGEGSYRWLETIRQYAQIKLGAAGEEAEARARHLVYFLALAEEAEAHLMGPQQVAWLARLEQAHDNLRAALRWALEGQAPLLGARLAGALWRFWYTHGYIAEGWRWLEAALAVPPAGAPAPALAPAVPPMPPARVRAKTLNGAGIFALRRGDYERATRFLEESRDLWQALGDAERTGRALNNLGLVALVQSDYARAQRFFEESLVLGRARGDHPGIALALVNLGFVLRCREDFARAAACYEESLTLARALHDEQGVAVALHNLGQLAHLQGDAARAGALLAESLTLARELGDQAAMVAGLTGLAAVWGARGQAAGAARLFGAAEALHDADQTQLAPAERLGYDRAVAASRAALGDARFAALWAAGRAMTLAEASAYALDPPTRTIAVAAAIIREDGCILIVQRPDRADMGGLWEFPGGKIEPGETPEAALVREIAEELGVAVAVDALYHIIDHQYPSGLTVHLRFYTCRRLSGPLHLLWGQALRWVAPADLPAYAYPAADTAVVARLAAESPGAPAPLSS